MLDTLLESNSRKKRSHAGLALSIALHTGLIGAALYATAQARPEPPAPPERLRPVYFPPAPRLAVPQMRTSIHRGAFPALDLRFVPPSVDIRLPVVDIPTTPTAPSDFESHAIGGSTVSSSERGNHESIGNGVFLVDQVEKQASLAQGAIPPRYPETLRTSGIEGRVVTRFIVNERGQVEVASIQVLPSNNLLFEAAVRTALIRMRFIPAEIGGRKVRQLVEMPFVFTLSR